VHLRLKVEVEIERLVPNQSPASHLVHENGIVEPTLRLCEINVLTVRLLSISFLV
jgi:hypothetical protein